MGTNYSTIHQHSPLRVPEKWGEQERRFVSQLEEIFDDLYRRFNRLRLEDMGPALKKTIVESADGVSTLEHTADEFTATFQKIGLSGAQTGITKVGENGIEVVHSDIDCKTVLDAAGMKILNADAEPIGGVYVPEGQSVAQAFMESIMNPTVPNLQIKVGQRRVFAPSDGRWLDMTGLFLYVNGVQKGGICVNNGITYLVGDLLSEDQTNVASVVSFDSVIAKTLYQE